MAIFNQLSDQRLDVEAIDMSELMFPLLFVQIRGGLKYANWSIIGNRPVQHYELPEYRDTNAFMDGSRGKLGGWSIESVTGAKYVETLDESSRKLEFYISWGYEGLEHRLATGHFWTDDIW